MLKNAVNDAIRELNLRVMGQQSAAHL
jgi:hypothetical protein